MQKKYFIDIPHWKLLIIRVLQILTLLGSGAYLFWRFNPLFWNNPFLSFILLVAEVIFFVNFIVHFPVLWLFPSKHIPVNKPEKDIKISIVIPTYNEPLDILQPTIMQAMAVAIPAKVLLSIVILDDGERPWLKEYVEEISNTSLIAVKYVTRTQRTGYKAGNINNYLNKYCNEDYILVLDADFIPKPNILNSYFQFLGNPNIGFLQAPQYFDNISKDDPFGQDPTIWFDILQVGRSAHNALICCGTPTLFSVEALRQIDGMRENTMTEDFATGVALQSQGFQAVYIRDELAVGKASSDMIDVVQKTQRYAAGAFEFLFFSHKWKFGKKLTFKQRFLHYTYPVAFFCTTFYADTYFIADNCFIYRH